MNWDELRRMKFSEEQIAEIDAEAAKEVRRLTDEDGKPQDLENLVSDAPGV